MCAHRAEQALTGLGDPLLGEWHEWSGVAYHIRRRLTPTEQQRIGPAIDIRGTPEARQRANQLGKLLTAIPPDLVQLELGDQ
jgi:hypothetical protein